jgi:hypothetical protein
MSALCILCIGFYVGRGAFSPWCCYERWDRFLFAEALASSAFYVVVNLLLRVNESRTCSSAWLRSAFLDACYVCYCLAREEPSDEVCVVFLDLLFDR